MKKGKVISMPASPDAQIRTRARNLPLGKCYINKDWEEPQMASVIVSRKHDNGNITYGFYLVDLNLLGVKDCFYAFNEPRVEMEDRIHEQIIEFVECDYALAHNIIYKGLAFAKYYGFEPMRDFTKTGIYILEENTDDIPKMDIPLGKDGMPVVITTYNRSMQREIAILEKTAGKGNFIVHHLDIPETGLFMDDDDYDDDDDIYDDDDDEFEDFMDDDFEDDDFEDDDDFDDEFDDDEFDDEDDDEFEDDEDGEYQSYDEIVEEIDTLGISEYTEKYGDNLTTAQILALTDAAFFDKFEIDTNQSDRTFELIVDDQRYDPVLDSPVELEKYSDSLQSIVNKLVDDVDAAFQEMETLVDEHSDDPELGILQINLLRDLDMRSELEQLTLYWYDRLPEHYAIRLLYAEWLTEMERFDEVFELFGNCPGLDALTTENKPFTDVMVSEFCACYVMAWLSKNDIEKAEPYYQILLLLENWTPFVMSALMAMMSNKKDALEKAQSEENKEDE